MNPSKHLGNELKYLERVLNSESWSATGGSWNHTLEQMFADKFGVRFAIAMNSGTATLHSALEAIGVKGREVISPALTVIMDSAVTLQAGAIPIYADVDPLTFNISAEDIERKITDRTKVIIVVALYGLPPDMDAIMDIAEHHHLVVIEDNAQMFSPEYKLRGDFASYSFETSKHLSCGEGGMLITNDKLYAERARKFAGHGYKDILADDGRVLSDPSVFQSPNYKRHDIIGYNYRLSEPSAAIALAQLERSSELVGLRKKAAHHFTNACSFAEYLTPQLVPEGYPHSYFTFGVLYDESVLGVSWEDFRKAYIAHGGDGIYGCWSVPYLEPALYDKMCPAGDKRCPAGDKRCHISESIQPKLMQFKTNYRDEKLAIDKAHALYKTIKAYERGEHEV